MSEYAKKASKLGIPQVNFMDQNEVIDYLLGKTSECQQIDAALRAQLLIKKSDLRSGKVAAASVAQKKRDVKAEEKEEQRLLDVSDYVLLNEKKIHSRSTILQCQKRSFLKVLQLGY